LIKITKLQKIMHEYYKNNSTLVSCGEKFSDIAPAPLTPCESDEICVDNQCVKRSEETPEYNSARDKEKKKFNRKHSLVKSGFGTMDSNRTWQFIAGMVRTGNVQAIYIHDSLIHQLRMAAYRAGDKHLLRGLKMGGKKYKVGGHQNHLHVRVFAKGARARGKTLSKKFNAVWRSYTSTRDWVRAGMPGRRRRIRVAPATPRRRP